MIDILYFFLTFFLLPTSTNIYNLKDNLPKIDEKKSLSVSIKENGEIKIINHGKQNTVPLLRIHDPHLETDVYSLWGKIKYDGVENPSYLELWNDFGKRKYFTRTKAGSGFMKKISGDSEYRIFSLPFNREFSTLKLEMLQLNLVFKGKGKIIFSPQVYLITGTKNPYKSIEKESVNNLLWWDDNTGSYIGGFLGILIGLCGAVNAFFIHKGKNYRLVKICIGIVLFVALASLIVGITAYFYQQPYAVYYPMLVSGAISVFVFVLQALAAKERFTKIQEKE